MKSLIVFAALLAGSTSFAQSPTGDSSSQLPTGFHSGFVSNNSFGRDLCDLNRGEIEFVDQGEGNYSLRWQENGFFRYPAPNGFCQNLFDATLTPTGKANEWNVNFSYSWDWSFGKAVLKGDILTITANYTGSNRAFLRLNARIRINSDKSFQYNRTIDLWGGPSLYASGFLR